LRSSVSLVEREILPHLSVERFLSTHEGRGSTSAALTTTQPPALVPPAASRGGSGTGAASAYFRAHQLDTPISFGITARSLPRNLPWNAPPQAYFDRTRQPTGRVRDPILVPIRSVVSNMIFVLSYSGLPRISTYGSPTWSRPSWNMDDALPLKGICP